MVLMVLVEMAVRTLSSKRLETPRSLCSLPFEVEKSVLASVRALRRDPSQGQVRKAEGLHWEKKMRCWSKGGSMLHNSFRAGL